jgi:hypothetical protein
MALIQPKPYWQKKNGLWTKVIPEPREMGVKKYDKKAYQETRKKKAQQRKAEREL